MKTRINAQEEMAFVLDTLTGKLDLSLFNGEWDCFARYCRMQATSISKSGHTDLADVIMAASNRAMRKSTNGSK